MTRRTTIALAVLALFCTFVGYASLDRGHGWGGDFSAYIMQAQSLLEGNPHEFVAANTQSLRESEAGVGPTAYPWGYPVLLAPVIATAGEDHMILKSTNLLWFLVFLVALYLLVRPRLSRWNSFLLVALVGLSPGILPFLDQIMSEVPYLAFSTLALVAIDRRVVFREEPLTPGVQDVLLGVLVFAAYFVRLHGVLLVGVLLAAHAVHYWRFRSRSGGPSISTLLPYSIPYLVLLALAGIEVLTLPVGTASYVLPLDSVSVSSVSHRGLKYLGLFEDFFDVPYRSFLYGGSLVLFGVGALRSMTRDYPLALYLALTVALFAVWPGYFQGFRYALPVVPLFVYFVVNAVDMERPISRDALAFRIVGYAFLLITLGLFAGKSIPSALGNLGDRRLIEGPYTPASQEMFEFVRRNSPEEARVVFRKPRVMRLMTGRHTVLLRGPSRMREGDVYVHHYESDTDLQFAADTVDALLRAERLRELYRSESFGVYRACPCDPVPDGETRARERVLHDAVGGAVGPHTDHSANSRPVSFLNSSTSSRSHPRSSARTSSPRRGRGILREKG